jgi:hypothetical protein
MKRSEMLKLLADAIEYHEWKGEPDEVADHILTFIEKQGMQPPLNVNSEGFSFFYEWEDEE